MLCSKDYLLLRTKLSTNVYLSLRKSGQEFVNQITLEDGIKELCQGERLTKMMAPVLPLARLEQEVAPNFQKASEDNAL